MVTHTSSFAPVIQPIPWTDWLRLAIGAAIVSAAAVVISQLTAFAVWPELALFDPLNSPPRSALFTALPAFGAAGVFAWLDRRVTRPEPMFLLISLIVLAISIVPDYLLPFAGKTFLASTVTAALHVVAAVSTVTVLVVGYRSVRRGA